MKLKLRNSFFLEFLKYFLLTGERERRLGETGITGGGDDGAGEAVDGRGCHRKARDRAHVGS